MFNTLLYPTGLFALAIFLCLNFSCTNPQADTVQTRTNTVLPADAPFAVAYSAIAKSPPVTLDTAAIQQHYQQRKRFVATEHAHFQRKWQWADNDSLRSMVLQSARSFLIRALRDSLFPAWTGTPWDYNGHCDAPLAGEIACGYFVSTPVRHCGFNLNRYKLAQQYSFDIVKVLCGEPVQRIGNGNLKQLLAWIGDQPDDLYIVGLDNHVGWLLHERDSTFMIHSDYTNTVTV